MAGGTNAVTWGFFHQAVQWLGLVAFGEPKAKAAFNPRVTCRWWWKCLTVTQRSNFISGGINWRKMLIKVL